MSDTKPRTGIIIKNGDNYHKIATVFWWKKDASVFLKLHKTMAGIPAHLGQYQVRNGLWGIVLPDKFTETETLIEHSSIKASGWESVKTLTKDYLAKANGVPLTNLQIIRPLWTLIPSLMEGNKLAEEDISEQDLIIEEQKYTRGRAIYFMALPKSVNEFQPDFVVRSGIKVDVALKSLELADLNILAIYHSESDWLNPLVTLRLPAPHNTLHFVCSVKTKRVSGNMKIVGQHIT
jgi:hypothetical protein